MKWCLRTSFLALKSNTNLGRMILWTSLNQTRGKKFTPISVLDVTIPKIYIIYQLQILQKKTFFFRPVSDLHLASIGLSLPFPFSISVMHKCVCRFMNWYNNALIFVAVAYPHFLFMHISHMWYQELLSVEYVLQQVWCQDVYKSLDKYVCNLSTSSAFSTMRWTQQSNTHYTIESTFQF